MTASNKALTAAIDAPDAEPAAWIVEFENGERELHWNDTKESLGESQMALYLGPPASRQPLDDETIFQIACGAADEMWPGVGGVGWTEEDAKFYRIFCRKIEAAIGALIGGCCAIIQSPGERLPVPSSVRTEVGHTSRACCLG